MKRSIITIALTLIIMILLKNFFILPIDENGMSFKLEYKIFIILVSISYMVIYKIVQYLSLLKINENYSRIDIVFMCFVVMFMFFPMMKINDAEINKRENRTLAKYIPFVQNGKINFSYGSNFELWFNDRFNKRDLFININNYINRKINGRTISDKAFVGENGWLYTKQYNAVAMFQNDNLFTDKELKKIKENLEGFDNWSKERGSKFYLFVIPDKETIYPEFYSKNYGKVNDISRVEQLVSYLEKNSDINFVYPYEQIMEKKKENIVYYKTGSHWNDTGTYVGYKALFSKIKKDFPQLEILDESSFNIKYKKQGDIDIANSLAINVDDEYTIEELTNAMYTPKKKDYTLEEIDFKDRERGVMSTYHNHDKSKKLKMFLYTDSFFYQAKDYAALSFETMKLIFVGFGNNFLFRKENGEILSNYESDIIVLSTTERFLQRLLHIETPEAN